MKTNLKLLILPAVAFLITLSDAKAQVSAGADLVSRYVWRGADFGNAAAIQPGIEFAAGDFAIGAWGSYALSSNTGGAEADLYVSYSVGDFSIGITDYYFPGEGFADVPGTVPVTSGNYFDYEDAHSFELNLGYTIESFSISANYFFANLDDDLYFELGYNIDNVDLFAGFGNESYTSDGEFNFVNLGLTASREIVVTDTFSLPVFGSAILNPDTEQFFLLFGVSF